MKTPLIIATCAPLLAMASAQGIHAKTSQATTHLPGRTSRTGPTPLGLKTKALVDAGAEAEAKGDLGEAEHLYLDAIALRPNVPFLRFNLAKLFDKEGRDQEAYVQYRIAVYGDSRSWSSTQEDPRALARFGDLSSRFGSSLEAARAYALAAEQSQRDDVRSPATIPTDQSLAALKSAAHTAAAIKLRGVGRNEEALAELRIAVSADSVYWVPHFYLARYLDGSKEREAMAEAAKAERLAPTSRHRSMVKRMRVENRLAVPN